MSAFYILPANPRRGLLAALPLALTIAVIAPPVAQATVAVPRSACTTLLQC